MLLFVSTTSNIINKAFNVTFHQSPVQFRYGQWFLHWLWLVLQTSFVCCSCFMFHVYLVFSAYFRLYYQPVLSYKPMPEQRDLFSEWRWLYMCLPTRMDRRHMQHSKYETFFLNISDIALLIWRDVKGFADEKQSSFSRMSNFSIIIKWIKT